MTELKFACPSCGQHIQCSPDCANKNVPCPACASLVRVPADAELADSPTVATDANPFQSPDESAKVSCAGAEAESQRQKGSNLANRSAVSRADNKPVSTIREALEAAAQPSELHCTCPVCQSELTISVTPKSNARPGSNGDKLSHSAAFQGATENLSAAEREKKIAAARGANPVTTYPVIKPRLDKILSEESAKLEFVPPQQPNSAEEYQPEIDPDQILRSHNSE